MTVFCFCCYRGFMVNNEERKPGEKKIDNYKVIHSKEKTIEMCMVLRKL